jgi:dihydropteroate synthase
MRVAQGAKRDAFLRQIGTRPLLMGVVNITPDSFSDGGHFLARDAALAHAQRLIAEGADLLDIGGESTRPGAEPLAESDERARVLPVIEGLAAQVREPISIDTYKAAVAEAALSAGASIVNDVSGLRYEPELAGVVAKRRAPVILMHTRGRSRGMYELAVYDDVIAEVKRELSSAVDRATGAGVSREKIVIDPGFGFAKRAEHSYAVLARLDALAELDRPILAGPSRKSFLKGALGEREPDQREWGTAAAVTASVLLGAHIVRVHGVREMVDVVRVADRLRESGVTR